MLLRQISYYGKYTPVCSSSSHQYLSSWLGINYAMIKKTALNFPSDWNIHHPNSFSKWKINLNFWHFLNLRKKETVRYTDDTFQLKRIYLSCFVNWVFVLLSPKFFLIYFVLLIYPNCVLYTLCAIAFKVLLRVT